jgi:hypothetical protein
MNVQSKLERQDQLYLYRRALGSAAHYADKLYSFDAVARSAGILIGNSTVQCNNG